MYKKILILFATLLVGSVLLFPLKGIAQAKDTTKALRANGDTSWVINTLKAPSSPAASLIGISPSSIQRPTDPSAFTTSFLNATNNFSTIPNSYAVDFAPAWLFSGRNISYNQFNSDKLKNNLWQSLDVSLAMNNVKDSLTNNTNTTLGIGIKISFLRGKINSKANHLVDQTYALLSQVTALQQQKLLAYEKIHPGYLALQRSLHTLPDSVRIIRIAQLNTTRDSIFKLANTELKNQLDSVKSIGQSIDFTRYGWKLDLASGLSYYFPKQNFSNGTLNNAGAWLTGGYEDEGNRISFLGILRYLYNPKHAFADANNILSQTNLSTFDSGIRLLFETVDSKFTFGGEVIYRSILNNTAVKSSTRYSVSTDYEIGKNQLLSFVFGRDFDGTINKGGSLLAALNFIIGFGNTKSIKPN